MSLLFDPLFSQKKIPFGLDLSDLSVKVVQLGFSKGRYDVVKYGSVSLAPGNVIDGEIKNPEGVREAILRCMEVSGVRTKQVFCSLPEGKSFLRVIEMPKLSADELKEAIQFQIEENVPMEAGQLYYDWMPTQKNFSQDAKKTNILLVAVAKSTVNTFLEVLESAGLEVIGMGTESIAQAQSLLSEEISSEETVLILDIGDRRTTLTFAVGGTPCFTSSIPLSSQMMTDAIAKTLHITPEKAEKIKCDQGIGSFIKKDPLFQSVEAILENLIGQIQISMDFFTGGLRFSHTLDRIVLCGGGANAEGLPIYLAKRLGRPVERGNPWIHMNNGNTVPRIPYKDSLRYSTAIGLAWQGVRYGRDEG